MKQHDTVAACAVCVTFSVAASSRKERLYGVREVHVCSVQRRGRVVEGFRGDAGEGEAGSMRKRSLG